MKLAIFIFILLVILIVTFSVKRRLGLLEIFFIWMAVWLFTHTLSSILIVNLGEISVPRGLQYYWFHLLKRLFLYPIIIILFIDYSIKFRSKLIKAAILSVNILLMPFLVFLFMKLGILDNDGYHFWHSILEWAFTIVLTYFSWNWYRNKYLARKPI